MTVPAVLNLAKERLEYVTNFITKIVLFAHCVTTRLDHLKNSSEKAMDENFATPALKKLQRYNKAIN